MSKNFWIVIGVVVVLAIVWFVWQLNTVNDTEILIQPENEEVMDDIFFDETVTEEDDVVLEEESDVVDLEVETETDLN